MKELGLLETLERKDGRLRMKPTESTSMKPTETPTMLDAFSYGCSAKAGDPDYDTKIEIAKQINIDYQKHIELNKDKLLQIIQNMSNINETDISEKDLNMFKLLSKGLKKMDEENGNYMTDLITKNSGLFEKFVQSIRNAQKTTNDKSVQKTTNDKSVQKKSFKPWRGGKQNGGKVGIFDNLKSVLSLDDYWRKPWGYSTVYNFFAENGRDVKNIITAIANMSYPSYDEMEIKITSNEHAYLDEHNDMDMIRDIIRGLYFSCKYIFLGTYYFTWEPARAAFIIMQGTTIATIGISCVTSLLALGYFEILALKPTLLTVDLIASTIASLFRTAGSVAVADAHAEYVVPTGEPIGNNDDGRSDDELAVAENIEYPHPANGYSLPAGGSKKTRHRKKNTKKNKKRKPRNTNRK